MSQVVTELVIDSDVRGVAPYEQGMGRAADAAAKGTAANDNMALSIAGVGVAMIGVIATINSGVNYIVGLNKQLADMQTFAKQVGLSLADIQGIKFGGAVAGLDEKTINAGLQQSAKLLNDASRNANSLSKELEANGLSVKNANGQLISQNQLLGIAADLIKRARNPGDAAVIAEMLGFSREWIPLLERGATAMAGLTDEARRAGAVLDDATIQKATEFDQQWRKSSIEMSSYLKAALLGLLPYADDLIERLSRFIQSIDTAKIRAAAEARAEEAGKAMDSLGIPREGGIKISMAPETDQALKDFNDESKSVWERIVAAAEVLSSALTRTDLQVIPQQDLKWEHGTSGAVTDTSNGTIAAGIRAEKNKQAWLAEGNAWKTLADDIVSGADKMVRGFSKVASKDTANDALDRAINQLEKHTAKIIADTQAVGLGVGVQEQYRAKALLVTAAQQSGTVVTQALSEKFDLIAKKAGDAKQALAEKTAQDQANFGLQTAFMSQIDQQIASVQRQLHGNAWPQYMNDGLSATLRLADSFRSLKDLVGTFASGLAKDLASGVPAVEALQSALKTLASSVLDAAVKRLVDHALSGLASAVMGAAGGAVAGASQAATMTTGATSAAGILTTAGATVGASIIAGATEAAAILGLTIPPAAATLPVAGAVAGTEIAAGSVAGGAALAAGAVAVEGAAFTLSAAMGPIGLAFAAIAAAAAIFGLSGGQSKGDKWLQGQIEGRDQRLSDYAQRSAMVGVDTNTREGAFRAFDQKNTRERLAENRAGGQAMQALLQVQVQEYNALAREWDQKSIDQAKATADAKLAIEKAAADRSLGFQNRLFAATNDFDTLEGQLKAFDRTAIQDRATEVQNGGQALVDLEAAQAAERLQITKSFADKEVEAVKVAEQAKLDAINGATKNVLNYLAGLQSGSNSTFSPQTVLTNARSTYTANLAVAQGNPANQATIDAVNKFPELAENFRVASRAVNASSSAYQNDLNQIISQGLALPAVAAATDPVVVEMRNVLAAIHEGNLAQATDATLIGTIKTAIDAGNASQVATALSTYFNSIDTNTSQSIDLSEMKTALAGMASNTALVSMFTRLDTDNSGSINRLELINAAAVSSNAYTKLVQDNTKATSDSTGNIASSSSGTKTATLDGNDTLDAIRSLQATASQQLTLLTAALSPTSIAFKVSVSGNTPGSQVGNPDVILKNQVVEALNKIVWNTYVISQNTAYGSNSALLHTHAGVGVSGAAWGGLIRGLGTGTSDSIPMWLSDREFVIKNAAVEKFGVGFFDQLNAGIMPREFNDNRPINVAAPVFRGGGGDSGNNAALLARIDKLTAQVEVLQKIVAAGSNMIAQTTDKAGKRNVEATKKAGNDTAEAIRMNKRNQRNAA